MPPLPIAIQYPLINGHRFSYASLEILLNGLPPMLGIKSANYSDELMPGDIYGTAPQILGQTRGKQKATFDFEIYLLEWEILRASLGFGGQGYGESYWIAQFGFYEIGQPPKQDLITGIRVNKVESANADGTDGSFVKVTCSALRIQQGARGDTIALAGPQSKIMI